MDCDEAIGVDIEVQFDDVIDCDVKSDDGDERVKRNVMVAELVRVLFWVVREVEMFTVGTV